MNLRLRALVLVLAASPVFGEELFPGGPVLPIPSPPAPAPKPAEPAKTETPPAPAVEKPAPEPADLRADIPASHKQSRPSSPQKVSTIPGIRIKDIKPTGVKDAFFTIERWVSRGKWGQISHNVKKGERIGKVDHGRDFTTPWRLLDLRKDKKQVAEHYSVLVLDPEGKQVFDAQGKPMREDKIRMVPLEIELITLEHLWAKDEASGKKFQVTLESGDKVSLPEFPEDQRPPPEPTERDE